MNSKSVIRILSFSFLVLLFACNKSNDWKGEEYVFIEYAVGEYHQDISGVFCPPPAVYSIYACYKFDNVSGEITSACNDINVNKNTELVLGLTHALYDEFGSGLIEVSEFPVNLESLSLHAITEEGTVNLQFRDSLISLGIDEEFYFKDTEIFVDLAGEGDEFDGLSVGDTICVQERGYSYRIKNWGFLEKGDFKKVNELNLY